MPRARLGLDLREVTRTLSAVGAVPPALAPLSDEHGWFGSCKMSTRKFSFGDLRIFQSVKVLSL